MAENCGMDSAKAEHSENGAQQKTLHDPAVIVKMPILATADQRIARNA
jgi:hypothetical protein